MTLVIDFGTVNTVGMVAGRLVTVDGAPWLPSAVHDGVVGADAVALGRGSAARDLKSRLDIDGIRAVFARIVLAAGPVDELVLTHPAGWPPSRVRVLVEAARGLAGPIRTLAEPVAVAAGRGVAPGETVLVVDVGGGTCDVAVVRGDAVLSEDSMPLDLDRRIVERVRPSLRSPVDAAADAALLESARASKELLSRHETAEIVLPDHRAVRLDRPEFERLVAEDVGRLVALATKVRTPNCRRVLLVGGASRMPVIARRLAAATGLPVEADPEPETAVVRGAYALTRLPPPAPVEPPVERSGRRRWGFLAGGLGLMLVAVLAVGFPGLSSTGGQPVAAPLALDGPVAEAPMPPVAAGTEMVNTDEARFTAGRPGTAVRYEHPAGATLAVTLDGVSTTLAAPAPYGEVPTGFRWLRVQFRIEHVAGPSWPHNPMDNIAAIDDRGQWLRPVGAGQIPCETDQDATTGVPAGAEVEVCGVIPVPVATPVEAVVFGAPGGDQAPVRFPVSVLPSAQHPATARVVGALGGPAVDVRSGVGRLHARFELVLTPSGYLDGRTPAPGNRFVVVRAALTATGPHELRVGRLYLRDDRGAYLAGMGYTGQLPDCPAPPAVLRPDEPAYGCYVFEIAADTPVTAVTHTTDLTKGIDLTRWPSWRA